MSMNLLHTLNFRKQVTITEMKSGTLTKSLIFSFLLHNQDNHDGVITHQEPDILECAVKWALGSITMNKASGSDGMPVELLFQILKDDALKMLHSICH